MSSRVKRPRYRRNRRRSRQLAAFLLAMATKWDGEDVADEITVDVVGANVLDLASEPNSPGPYTLRGARPPELNSLATIPRFWIAWDGDFKATVYTSREALIAERGAVDLAAWDLSKVFASLTATLKTCNTTDAGTTVATVATLGTCASLGATVAITGSTFAANTLTIVGHGYVVDQGPFYLTGADLPDGLSAATPYWIKTVPDVDTFTLTASLGGAVVDTLDDGSGAMSIRPVNIDISLDTLEVTAHGLATGDGPLRLTTNGALPAGAVVSTDYWAIVTTANRFKLATTRALAIDGTPVNLTDIGSGTQTVQNCNVDTTTEKFHKATHGLSTGQLVRVSTDGALPTGLAAATNYWCIAIDANYFQLASSLANALAGTAISLTAVGSGTTTVLLCNIDTTLDTYAFATAHGFVTGDGPVRATTGTTLPTGVSAATDYYVVRVSDTVLKLADTEAHALANTNIVNITAIGAGTQTLTLASADVTEEGVRIVGHGMTTGDGPIRLTTDSALPTGLNTGTDYYVIAVDDDHVAFATTYLLALAGTKVNLTGIGSGSHTLVRALKIGKDLSSEGIFCWLSQLVSKELMSNADVADVDDVFV